MEGKGDRETRGVIPNTFEHLFASIDADKSGREYLVKVSSLELYNEEIRDLLGRDPTAKLELREEAGVVVVQGLSSFVVGCVEDMEKCLEVGRKNRVVGETSMNKGSSRSHCIFSITVASSHQDEKGNDHARVAKLNLVRRRAGRGPCRIRHGLAGAQGRRAAQPGEVRRWQAGVSQKCRQGHRRWTWRALSVPGRRVQRGRGSRRASTSTSV